MILSNYKSHKDNAARVVQKNGTYYRYIFIEYKKDYDRLILSGLYQKLVANNLLISHQEVPIDNSDPSTYKLLLPDQIIFQSYPYEWSYEQWKKVIKSFIEINLIALQYGMLLKDATPYNFYLKEGKAILFDTSSFIEFKDGDNWLAYRQFCEELLSPFALMHYLGQRWSKFFRTHLHGMPLSFVSKQLPLRSWLNATCFIHIHMHANFDNEKISVDYKKTKGFSKEKLITLLGFIEKNISNWTNAFTYKNHWSGYYENTIESIQYIKDKEIIVENWIVQIEPSKVLDLGANTGKFSKIAAKYAKEVIAIESDPHCVDNIEHQILKENLKNIYVLVGELSEPSPALGILNKENDSLLDRIKVDLVLSLALIHHLCITNYMSMQQITEMLARFTSNYAIVEFIPREDQKVRILMKGRETNFKEYNEEVFIHHFENAFQLIEKKEIAGSNRVLYLWKKK